MKPATILRRRVRRNGVVAANGHAVVTMALPSVSAAPRLVPARAGDHAAIHQLLLRQFRGPSALEFQAQLDEPLYEPTDRLLVKHREDVVAHLRLTKRVLQFGPLRIPSAGFMDLATATPWQRRGFASALIGAGERQAASEGAAVGLTRTTAADLFARHGWTACGRQTYSVAGARQILAHLRVVAPPDVLNASEDQNAADALLSRRSPRIPLLVRPLRRMELPALVTLYGQCAAGAYGATVRDEVYWDWLMARHAFERGYVAILGDHHLELPELLAAVAGCVFVSGGRIVEMLSRPGATPAIGLALLARVCSDAVERSQYDVRLDAPPNHPLHQVFRAAGGSYHSTEEHDGEVSMARMFNPLQTLRDMSGDLLLRARAAGLAPQVLGLEVFNFDADLRRTTHEDARSYRLIVTSRKVRLVPGNLGRNYLALRRRDLTPLLLGHWRLEDAIAAGRIRASTQRAQRAAEVLFPQLPWHRPPLDDLVA
ncbi:MAG: GNAT family N-acetyltransferase [Pirellulaceae bacterium]